MIPVRNTGHLIENEIDGDMLVLAMETGVFHAMKPVALAIWQLIDGSRDLDGIVAVLTEQFDVSVDTCRADVERFLGQLRSAGLVRFA